MKILRLWELIDLAQENDGAQSIHLNPGRPPMVRIQDTGLRPLSDTFEPLGYRDIILMLQMVVEPERWDDMERTGQGEVLLTPSGSGRPVSLSVFRTTETWAAVVHL
jgi:Tfp pilus assembly pilus retraction ATPase PilT